MTAAEWIAKCRAALGLLSAYQSLREMAGDLNAAVAVGSLGIRGTDIAAAEDDARTSLPAALDALEAVLAIIGRQEYRTPGAPETYDQWHEARSGLADEIEQAIESTLRGES